MSLSKFLAAVLVFPTLQKTPNHYSELQQDMQGEEAGAALFLRLLTFVSFLLRRIKASLGCKRCYVPLKAATDSEKIWKATVCWNLLDKTEQKAGNSYSSQYLASCCMSWARISDYLFGKETTIVWWSHLLLNKYNFSLLVASAFYSFVVVGVISIYAP